MVWKSSGYQDNTELAKVSLALSVESTESEEIHLKVEVCCNLQKGFIQRAVSRHVQ